MKINFIGVVALLFILQGNSFAQNGSISLAVGPAFGKPTITELPGYKMSGYSDGAISLTGLYNLGEKVGLVMDAGISNRGMVFTQPVSVGTYDPLLGTTSYRDETNKYRHSFSYFDNSLLLRATVEGKFKFYANGGLYYSALLKAKKLVVDEYYDSNGTSGISEIHGKYDNGSNFLYRKSDYGMTVGLGIQKGRFGLDYRYYHGLKEISNEVSLVSIKHSFSTVKITFVMVKFKSTLMPHTHAHKKKAR